MKIQECVGKSVRVIVRVGGWGECVMAKAGKLVYSGGEYRIICRKDGEYCSFKGEQVDFINEYIRESKIIPEIFLR